MHLTFLYGPPAAGKHTIGQALSDLTGTAFFYNHLTVDVAKAVFGFRTANYFDLTEVLRRETITMAAKRDTSLIFTYAYAGRNHDLNEDLLVDDDVQIQEFADIVTENGGVVDFVQLIAPHNELLDRVENESRKKLEKLADRDILEGFLETGNRLVPVPVSQGRNLVIDTTRYTPVQAAQLIADHYSYAY